MSTVCGTPSYLAPEILTGQKYTTQCDIWSLGVILYTLLCGYPPFSDDNNAAMVETIKSGKLDFPDEDWKNISAEAKDLITRCLKVAPEMRVNCTEILNHPWMITEGNDNNNPQARERLKKYLARRRLKIAQSVVYFSKLLEKKMKI